MPKHGQIKCHETSCGKLFTPRTYRNLFCSRRCFMKHYRRAENRCPAFVCPRCHQVTKLTFEPVKEPKKWLEFVCPHCQEPIRHFTNHDDAIVPATN